MKSKAVKIIFVVLMPFFAIGIYWLYHYGPDSFSHNETRKLYQRYLKAEATIISQDGNGCVGRNARTIWTLQFKDNKGILRTTTMDQATSLSQGNGTKINIYYDSTNVNQLTSEKSYQLAME